MSVASDCNQTVPLLMEMRRLDEEILYHATEFRRRLREGQLPRRRLTLVFVEYLFSISGLLRALCPAVIMRIGSHECHPCMAPPYSLAEDFGEDFNEDGGGSDGESVSERRNDGSEVNERCWLITAKRKVLEARRQANRILDSMREFNNGRPEPQQMMHSGAIMAIQQALFCISENVKLQRVG
jgi:hypothetical protein